MWGRVHPIMYADAFGMRSNQHTIYDAINSIKISLSSVKNDLSSVNDDLSSVRRKFLFGY